MNETPEQAAIRETFEETGYQIEMEKLVGQYYRPQLNDIRTVFLVGLWVANRSSADQKRFR